MLSNAVAASYMWLLSSWNVAYVTKEVNFPFYLCSFLYSHMWALAARLDRAVLDQLHPSPSVCNDQRLRREVIYLKLWIPNPLLSSAAPTDHLLLSFPL